MSTQAVSSLSIYQELQNFYQNRQSDLQSLGKALQSGDLKAAQQAYSQLVALGQSGPFSNSEPFYRTDRATDFEAIGQALSSGDLASAQTAFAKLQQTFGQSSSSVQTSPPYTVHLASQSLNNSQSSTGTGATSGASSSESIYEQLQEYRSERQTDLQQLGQALGAGDLKTAQQDYNNLVQLGEQGPFSSGQPFQRSDRAEDFQALGKALQSGDMTGAQKAFATLESTFGKVQGGPEPRVPKPVASTDAAGISEIVVNIGGSGSSEAQNASVSELVINLPTLTSGSSPEEAQINFGGSSGAPEQLTIQVGQTQDQSGNAGEQISINLQQANNSENIILNIFGAGASSAPTQGSSLNVQG